MQPPKTVATPPTSIASCYVRHPWLRLLIISNELPQGLSTMSRGTPAEARRMNAPRRGLHRDEAAIYVGVSPSKFDELVKDGRMPKPKKIDARRIFDIRALDLAFEQLTDESDENPWDGGMS